MGPGWPDGRLHLGRGGDRGGGPSPADTLGPGRRGAWPFATGAAAQGVRRPSAWWSAHGRGAEVILERFAVEVAEKKNVRYPG